MGSYFREVAERVKEDLTHSKAKTIEDVEKTFAKTYGEKISALERELERARVKNIIEYLIILMAGLVLGFILKGFIL